MVGDMLQCIQDAHMFFLTKLCQPFHNGVIPIVKELSDIVWRNIRALIYDLNQFIYNFKSHALLQRFASMALSSSLLNHRQIVAWLIALSGKCELYF